MNYKRGILILSVVLVAAVLGYVSVDLSSDPVSQSNKIDRQALVDDKVQFNYVSPTDREEFDDRHDGSYEKELRYDADRAKEILKGEKVLHFKNKEDMENFRQRFEGNGLRVVKEISGLNLLKVRFITQKDKNNFLARFPEIDVISDNDAVAIPDPLLQAAAVGFKSDPLKFLGISDNTNWGAGVTVAVIDTGVAKHPALKGNITHVDLINDGLPVDSFHGTAVASLIAGDSHHVKGVSPGASIIDIRALNSDGSGNAFTVAEGIYEAVERGAQVINLSLGSPTDSAVLKAAVDYAQSHGVILVAAVGNEGTGQVSYPAHYPGVIGVGASDAQSNYLPFSNKGQEVDISAPGIEIPAAGIKGETVLFTGTSAAAPLVAGTAARMLEEDPYLSSQEVLGALQGAANDAGPPGNDVYYGEGILNVGRVEKAKSTFTDVAAAGFHLEKTADPNVISLYAIGENRGTEDIDRVEMSVSYPGFEKNYTFRNVKKSQSFYETLSLDIDSPVIADEQEIILHIKAIKHGKVIKSEFKGVKIRFKPQ